MFAYIDETGNTGRNLFDRDQPDFFTGALLCRYDFDQNFDVDIKSIAKKVNCESIHASQLGFGRIDEIAPDIERVFKDASVSFAFSRVEKSYLLVTKFFDTFFDSGENAAVSWHHYNIRSLRLMLVFKFASVIDEDVAREFWTCLLEPKIEQAYSRIPEISERLISNCAKLSDQRAKKILIEGLKWVGQYPKSVHFLDDRKLAIKGHFPNPVAFINLLEGIENVSKAWGVPVQKLIHDKQSEFESILEYWHRLYSNASPEEMHWAGEKYSLLKVPGSKFEVKSDEDSAGIQCLDLILWLFKKWFTVKQLGSSRDVFPKRIRKLMASVFPQSIFNDFSFNGVARVAEADLQIKMSSPLSAKAVTDGQEMLRRFEENRTKSMEQYRIDKVPPFARD